MVEERILILVFWGGCSWKKSVGSWVLLGMRVGRLDCAERKWMESKQDEGVKRRVYNGNKWE